MKLKEYLDGTKQDRVSKYFITRKYLFVDKFIENVKSGDKKSLDIGSNFGLFSELLKEKGYDSYGLEVEKQRVDWAKKNGKARYVLGSVEKIPFKDNSFDIILFLDTLEHVLDRGKALKEINRVLKPNGKVIITVPNTSSYFYLRSFLTYLLKSAKPWKNVHYQQNYFHWEHQINQFLKIIDSRAILSVPFFEPKIIKGNRLSDFEFNKKKLAWMSADPVFICTKRKERIKDNSDTTII